MVVSVCVCLQTSLCRVFACTETWVQESLPLCTGVLIYFQIQRIDHGSRTGTVAIRIEEREQDN